MAAPWREVTPLAVGFPLVCADPTGAPGELAASGFSPRGRGFGSTQTVGEVPNAGNAALAVASDGRARVALPGLGTMRVAERPPGGALGTATAKASHFGSIAGAASGRTRARPRPPLR
jgi:hypothetical protein